jgi:hypothetical protein
MAEQIRQAVREHYIVGRMYLGEGLDMYLGEGPDLEQRVRAETLVEKLRAFQTHVSLDTPLLYRVESCAETRNCRKEKSNGGP